MVNFVDTTMQRAALLCSLLVDLVRIQLER